MTKTQNATRRLIRTWSVVIGVTTLSIACSGGDSDSIQGSSDSQENPYANGFRLVRMVTDNLLFDSIDSEINLDYNDENRQMTRTEVTGADDENVYVRQYFLGPSGLLVKRSIGDEGERDVVEYVYNQAGQLLEYDRGYSRVVFEYTNGILQKLDEGALDVVFNYDADGRLISTLDSVLKITTSIEYNQAGQVSRAMEVNQFGEAGYSYEYEYDEQGNLVKQTQVRPFGDVYQITSYEYEEAPLETYNHQLFRLKLQPFYNVVFSFIPD